jgi:glutathione S-transferase
MSRMRLISFDLCPYVQRSTIALREKGIDFDIEYIDLQNKPAWFLDISPHGKVPLLQVDGEVLFESTVILEYLDETQEPRLHPQHPLQRARDRAWFSVADAANGAVYMMMTAADRAALEAQAGKLKATLLQLDAQLVGPLWRGESMSAVDAVAYPALQRARWLDDLYPDLQVFAATPKVDNWERALAVRPSVIASTVPDIRQRFEVAIQHYGAVHRPT